MNLIIEYFRIPALHLQSGLDEVEWRGERSGDGACSEAAGEAAHGAAQRSLWQQLPPPQQASTLLVTEEVDAVERGPCQLMKPVRAVSVNARCLYD